MSLEEFHIEPIGSGVKLSVWDYPKIGNQKELKGWTKQRRKTVRWLLDCSVLHEPVSAR